MFDVDIDVKDTLDKSRYGVQAIIYDSDDKVIKPHQSGRYFKTNMAVDAETNMAAIDHKEAQTMGFIKIDLLNNTSMNSFTNMDEYLSAISTPPDWEMLWSDQDRVRMLPQIGNHFWILKKVKPTSIEEIADVLALIRPAKSHLVNPYLLNKPAIRKILYNKDDKYYYKKSHAIAYSHLIVAKMNKIDKKPIEAFVTLR